MPALAHPARRPFRVAKVFAVNEACTPGHTALRDGCTPKGEGDPGELPTAVTPKPPPKPPPKPLPGKGPPQRPQLQTAPSPEDHPKAGTVRRPLGDDDVPRHVEGQGAEIKKSITPAQKKALKTYTEESDEPGNFADLNEASRRCPKTLDCLSPKEKEVFDEVNGLASKNKLDKPAMVYRGIALEGKEKKDFVEGAKAAAKSGGTMTFNGVSSTSLDPETGASFAEGGGVVFEIKAKSGAYVDPVSEVKGEREFIIPHGKKFKVVAVQDKQEFTNVGGRVTNTVTVVQMEEVD